MNTTKLFFMAALVVIFAACSNDDDELIQQPAKMITITAQLAPKSESASTRAVSESGDNIVVDWAVNEHLAILYTKDGNQMADARITAVDASGAATITFSVVDGTPDNTDCQIIYPLSAAKKDHTGLKDNATLLANQNGTLNADLDVRVGAGKIQTSTPGLDVTTQPAAQFAIWKLTLNKMATNLYITADGVLIAGANLSSKGNEFTVAVPAVSSKTVAVVATDQSNCYCYSKETVSLTAGKYYKSSVTMEGISNDESRVVFQLTNQNKVCIENKTVVLSGLTNTGGIVCEGAATIILLETNSITGASNTPAIQAGNNTLTITGIGTLLASGGENCAGIGSSGDCFCVDIIICGGTITANGGAYAAGIGTGKGGGCGDITITEGVTKVTATKGFGSDESIGSGSGGACSRVTICGVEGAIAASPYTYPALPGKFTINDSGRKVYFSHGNLQATCSTADDDVNTQETWTWHFAEHQWDYIGAAVANNSINGNGSVSDAGTVDLFGWSTSTTYGIYNSTTASDYSGDFYDWGKAIGGGWRTLSNGEWVYLFNTRIGSTVNETNGTLSARYTLATINTDVNSGVKGIILFPDGVNFAADEASWNNINGVSDYATKCTSTQWDALAAKGCVFLPAAGYRNGTSVSEVGAHGYYWSSMKHGETDTGASGLSFEYELNPDASNNYNRYYGYSVRLVYDAN